MSNKKIFIIIPTGNEYFFVVNYPDSYRDQKSKTKINT
jgi:hypothetical protein